MDDLLAVLPRLLRRPLLPGGAVQPEKSSRSSMRLSFGLVDPSLHDEALRRLAAALREVRRRGRGAGATGALS